MMVPECPGSVGNMVEKATETYLLGSKLQITALLTQIVELELQQLHLRRQQA